jgi:hypothetical protein
MPARCWPASAQLGERGWLGVRPKRELLANHKELALRVQRIEDVQHRQMSVITILADEIEELKLVPPPGPKRRIGFPRSA